MKIAIASGKGGTGKTLVATGIAQSFAGAQTVLVDADVEEPNAGLFIPHTRTGTREISRPVPRIDPELCNYCGYCAEICQFNALVVLPEQVMVFDELCHSCGACEFLCPQHAIYEEEHPIGVIEEARFNEAVLLTGRLAVGEAQSPPLIKAVKEQAGDAELVLVDCPPGTTCPMVEAISDCDHCILVTEPTPFGLHDLALSLQACDMVNVPCSILINRDRGDSLNVAELAAQYQAPIIGRIPYNEDLARAYARGENPTTVFPELETIWQDVIAACKEAVSCKKSWS